MTEEDLIRALIRELKFRRNTATAFVRTHGYCEYCGQDVMRSRLGYAIAALDHLLPKSKHKGVAKNPANWVLSCGMCNSIKRAHSVLEAGEDVGEMLGSNRSQLISRARNYIEDKKNYYDSAWKRLGELFETHWRSENPGSGVSVGGGSGLTSGST